MSKRECGSCSLCCKVLDVPALSKPGGQWCKHFAAGQGCTIHQLRPKSCREFACLWLSEDWLGDEWKPSTSKFVLAWEYDFRCLSVFVDQNHRNAWRGEPYYTALKALSEKHLLESRIVMVVETAKRILILPDQEIELGPRGDVFDWEVTRRDTPQGPKFDVVFDNITGSDKARGGQDFNFYSR
jgi:hypothetical protein